MDNFNAFDNIFGGHDYNLDGNMYHTEDNIFGGENIYENGNFVASSKDNIYGGHDYYDSDYTHVASTKSNIHGGEDVYGADWSYQGSSNASNFMGNGSMQMFDTMEVGNCSTILGYSDPLAHVGNYIMPSLLL